MTSRTDTNLYFVLTSVCYAVELVGGEESRSTVISSRRVEPSRPANHAQPLSIAADGCRGELNAPFDTAMFFKTVGL